MANRLKLNSLAARLIAAAAIWTVIGLAAGGWVLSAAFRNAADSNLDDALRADMDGLIAAADPGVDGHITLADRFLNHRFDRVYSGLYYQITDGRGQRQISHSLFDGDIRFSDSQRSGELTWGHAPGPDGQHLRTLSQRVEFPAAETPAPGDMHTYTFTVAGDLAEVDADTANFNTTLFWSFLLLGAGLVLAILIQVRIGLLPLRRLARALARIRDGSTRQLEGDFPAEIAPLATELNSLIAHSAEVVARARTHVSNLAHFLKTPLTVLAGEAEAHADIPGAAPLADAVKRQVFSMRRQVDHYLARARAAGSVDVLGNRTEVAPVLADLSRVLARMHAARGIRIDVDCPPALYFRGERQDLEEMTGNLIDNACKWSHGLVRVICARQGGQLVLTVEDDGPGLSEAERAQVGQRGERLDESVPGSGLGLAIVGDISKLYGGFFALEASPLGGLLARLTLPLLG